MKTIIATTIVAAIAMPAHAEIYNYSCNACLFPKIVTDDGFDGCDVVAGKTYPLRVDDQQKRARMAGQEIPHNRTTLWEIWLAR